MKRFKILMIGVLFIGTVFLTGCKKEDQIEKNLWNKGGMWNIEKYQNNYSFGTSESYVLNDAGTFEFKKDGTGKLIMTDDGTYTNLFTYENTENSLTLTFKEGQMYSEGDKEKYTLDWKKNTINLYSYTSTSNQNGIIYDEYIIDLKKK